MPQSLSAVYVHLVFSTKHRIARLKDPAVRSETHAYLAGISKKLDSPTILVGGVDDHVHMLARLSRTISQSAWIKELKRASSLWIKEGYPDLKGLRGNRATGFFQSAGRTWRRSPLTSRGKKNTIEQNRSKRSSGPC